MTFIRESCGSKCWQNHLPVLFVLIAETLGETEWELLSDGVGEEADAGTGLACFASFLSAAAKLAWPPDIDESVVAGVESLLCTTGCNPGERGVV